eukprot:gb/GFBE01014887.1/.p1 GENE.gb/GFBE01014887.1/~~gb/GFBE01014887.1/.p1  ORF type:complete len:356 (+),score=67.72 gb/GFBE01014887.1/:1-1068(+)
MPGYTSQASGPSSLQTAAAVTLFVGAYVALVPGLIDDLFSLKAEVEFFGARMPVVDLTKSTVGTIKHLMEEKHPLPAALILLFSVVIPFLKLAVVLLAFGRGLFSSTKRSPTQHLVHGLQEVSKWATVDAFCVMTFAAAFSGMSSSSLMLDLELKRGFYCFLAYCILSVGAALAMPLDSSGFVPPPLFRRLALHNLVRVGALIGTCAIWMLILVTPLIQISIDQFSLHHKLSIVGIFGGLREAGLWVPAVSFAALVMLFPGLHAFLTAAQELDFEVPCVRVLPALGHFAMADVLLLSIAVTRLAATGLSNQLTVQVLPGASFLLTLLVLKPLMPWAATTAAARQRAKMAEYVEEI